MADWAWPVLLGVLGAVFGSFIATVAVRWPEGRSALKGRSACDGCGKALGPHELVPVLSYAVLRGRCAGCGAAIRIGHPVTELLGLAIGVSAGLVSPGLDGATGAMFGWVLLALAALDLAAFWLPNALTFALAVTGPLAGFAPLPDLLIGGVAGFASLWLVAAGYRAWRGREGLGGGDPKLFGAIGLWLGWQALPMVLLGASVLGLSAALALQLGGRRVTMQDRLPLGVFLAAAAWLSWLAARGM
jgi:leader peptidase (prepilin peptidase)/N-methyltransferase